MWYEGIFEEMESLKDSQQAVKMSAYMKDRFEFLGIPKPKLKEVEKPYLKEGRSLKDIDWDFVNICWNKNYREAQYVAIDYLSMNSKKLTGKDLKSLENIIISKSWWETVDSIDGLVGGIVMKNKELEEMMVQWSVCDNIWKRRVAIDFQQKYKEKTNSTLLERIICNNLESSEFFINKAIGWSLRDYSKVNPEWVRNFIEKYKNRMAPLSVKEGSKYL